MMQQKFRDTLSKIGIQEDAIAFYLAILKNPGRTVYELSKRTGVAKDRAYRLCESLETNKLITVLNPGQKQKRLIPASLRDKAGEIEKQGRKLWKVADSLKYLHSAVPFLDERQNTSQLEILYEDNFGEDWSGAAYLPWEEVLAYGDFEMFVGRGGIGPDQEFIRKRVKRGKKGYAWIAPGAYTNELIKNDAKHMRTTAVLDLPELRNHFVSIFPSIDQIMAWTKDEDGIIRGTRITNKTLARLHEGLHKHFANMVEYNFENR